MEETTKKRIGYIDALRGFAMILVVYFHISAYGFGSYETGYNGLIEHLRMPLFFFISGLLFNLSSWKENPQQQFRNKFMALIVPTAIFMILYLIIIGYMNFSFLGHLCYLNLSSSMVLQRQFLTRGILLKVKYGL